MADSTTVTYKDKRGEFRWRRTATNGEIVGASSESYKAKKDCDANANRDTAKDKWEFYKDKGGKHRSARRLHRQRQAGGQSHRRLQLKEKCRTQRHAERLEGLRSPSNSVIPANAGTQTCNEHTCGKPGSRLSSG